jgi:DNA-binding MarR family transcriptional regulator
MRASTQQTYRPTKFRRTSYLVKRLENAVREMLEVALADRDVTLAQYTLLSMFSDVDGMSSADAARRCGVSKQASNEIINVLEAKRLISRTEDRENRRILRIKLTTAGRRLLAACDTAADRSEREFFSKLSATQVSALREAIEILIA